MKLFFCFLFFYIINSSAFAQGVNCDYYLEKSDSLLENSWESIENAAEYIKRYEICLNSLNSDEFKNKVVNLSKFSLISLSGSRKNGWARAKGTNDVYIIDENYQQVKKLPCDTIFPFRGNEYCIMQIKEACCFKQTVINYKGDIILPKDKSHSYYQQIYPFNKITKKALAYWVPVFPSPRYDILQYRNDSVYIVAKDVIPSNDNSGPIGFYSRGFFGFCDSAGIEVISPQYQEIKKFASGLCAVQKNGLWGYINDKGVVVIDFKYYYADNFENGKALVYEDKKLKKGTYINKTGKSF
jgi:hypothetical protein